MNEFKKGEKYRVLKVKQDGSVPKAGSIIKIESDEKDPIERGEGERKIIYSMVEGEGAKDGSTHFWSESKLAEKLELVE